MSKFPTTWLLVLQAEYLFIPKGTDEPYPIGFETDEEFGNEVNFSNDEGCFTIGDDHIYYKISEANKAREELLIKHPNWKMNVYTLNHNDHERGSASMVSDESHPVNRLGYGIFVFKESILRISAGFKDDRGVFVIISMDKDEIFNNLISTNDIPRDLKDKPRSEWNEEDWKYATITLGTTIQNFWNCE